MDTSASPQHTQGCRICDEHYKLRVIYIYMRLNNETLKIWKANIHVTMRDHVIINIAIVIVAKIG